MHVQRYRDGNKSNNIIINELEMQTRRAYVEAFLTKTTTTIK